MDDTAPISTDYDTWVTDPGNLARHLEGILSSVGATARQQATATSRRRRWPYLVDPDAGHLNGRDLCWICASGLVHTGPNLPRLRACRWCLAVDRSHAARLGLLHLLPVFDWPAPPVRDRGVAFALGAPAREAIATAWSGVSVLDRWRRDSVRLAYAWMEVTGGEVVDLSEWQSRITLGPNRSRACWAAYVGGYQPALRRVLHVMPAATSVTG